MLQLKQVSRERLNVSFSIRSDDSHCDRIPFSVIADQTCIPI